MARTINTSHPLYGNLIALIGVEDDGVTLKDFFTPSRSFTIQTSAPNGATFGTGTYGAHFRTGGTYDNSRGAIISPSITLPGGAASIFVVHNGITARANDSNLTRQESFFIGRANYTSGIDGALILWGTGANATTASHAFVGGGGEYIAVGTTAFEGSTARSLCATRNNTSTRRLRVFVDGTQEAENASAGGTGSANFTLDKIGGVSPGLIGYLDTNIVWIAVFDKELSALEISDLHTSLGANNEFGLMEPASAGFTITADSGTYSVAGVNSDLLATRTISADVGSYSWSGINANLVKETPGAIVIVAETGSYIITGTDAYRDLAFNAEPSTYSITGYDVSFTLTEPMAYSIIAESGTYTFSGRTAYLLGPGDTIPTASSSKLAINIGLRL